MKGKCKCKIKQRKTKSTVCELDRVYKAIKVTTNVTGVLCAKEKWEKEDSARLLISEQLDNQEQLFIITDFRFDRQHRKEEEVYEDGFVMEL